MSATSAAVMEMGALEEEEEEAEGERLGLAVCD